MSIQTKRVNRHGGRMVVALTCMTVGISSAIAGNGAGDAHESPKQLVDALHSAFGVHHARAVHAKGVLLKGTFSPTAQAKKLSRAAVFSGASIPVTVRFSDFTGIPDIPDTADGANPRGFAVKFHLSGGAETDIVTHSFNGFPTATADEFGQLLRAIGASGEGVAKPTALDQFLTNHPIAKTFLTSQKPAPVSYATLSYFGVNSFCFINARGQRTYVRYRFVPKAGEQFLDAASLNSKGPGYLLDEIATRIAATPVEYAWFAQISEKGDVIDDPSVAWPESRKLVKLGTITIAKLLVDQSTADKTMLFMPGNLVAGIEAADPMIAMRNAAYPISFGERQ